MSSFLFGSSSSSSSSSTSSSCTATGGDGTSSLSLLHNYKISIIINNFKDGLHPPATQRDINLQVLSHRLCVIGERLEVGIKEGPTVINVTEYVPNVTQLIEKTKISYQ